MKDFLVTAESAKSPGEAHDEIFGVLGPHLSRWGYRMTQDSPTALMFECRYTSRWTYIPAVLLFPIGLLCLLIKSTGAISVTITQAGNGSLVTVQGQAGRRLRGALLDGSMISGVHSGVQSERNSAQLGNTGPL